MLYPKLFKWALALTAVTLAFKHYAHAQPMFLNPPANTQFEHFASNTPAFSWDRALKTRDFQAYLDFYDLNFDAVTHYAGHLKDVHKENIFVHVYKNKDQTRGTLLAFHGYFVHSALLKYVIKRALSEGYTVIVADLPGHGLSGGKQASIDAFSEYADLIEQLTQRLTQHLPQPYFLLGHSTGGSGVWEYALKNPYNPYKKIVLGAPLVRSYAWGLSAAGFYMGQNILSEVPRLLRPTTREPEFLDLVLRDPLQYPGTPVQWVKALIEWNDQQIETYPPSAKPLLIIQGTEDTVVEAEYNIPFLQRKFPFAETQWNAFKIKALLNLSFFLLNCDLIFV